MAETLNCEKREQTGTLRMRRMRQEGKIPAVIYGRGDNVSLTLSEKEINAVIRAGSPIVELAGDVTTSAMISDVQWDAFGQNVLHLDLARIDASESVEITLSVELVGVSPGSKNGGTVRQLIQEVDVMCPATNVPDKLPLKINDLQLNGSITVGEIVLPEGAKLITSGDEVAVQCLVVETASEEADDDGGGEGAAEPEVIGRKTDEEEGEGDA